MALRDCGEAMGRDDHRVSFHHCFNSSLDLCSSSSLRDAGNAAAAHAMLSTHIVTHGADCGRDTKAAVVQVKVQYEAPVEQNSSPHMQQQPTHQRL